MMKDNIWAFANALSQVCVEDDSVSLSDSCEFPGSDELSPASGSAKTWSALSLKTTWLLSFADGALATAYQVRGSVISVDISLTAQTHPSSSTTPSASILVSLRAGSPTSNGSRRVRPRPPCRTPRLEKRSKPRFSKLCRPKTLSLLRPRPTASR